MRTLLIVVALSFAVAIVAPAAEAAHAGPICWHEYVDNYKRIVPTAQNCVNNALGWICSSICALP